MSVFLKAYNDLFCTGARENDLNFVLISAIPGLCPADRELVGDKVVGAYLTLCPEYSFVCESSVNGSIVAFAVAAPDAKKLFTR